ncbi:hypothetical protein TNCV_154261, partial [Trichonephila clavipes]
DMKKDFIALCMSYNYIAGKQGRLEASGNWTKLEGLVTMATSSQS